MIFALRKNNILSIVATAPLVALLFFVHVPFTFAQNSLALSVTPTLFEMAAHPGQVWQSSVKVINSNAYEIVVYADAVNFAPQGESGQGKLLPVFEEMTEGATLAEWIDISNGAVVIPPEQSVQIPFIVEVPEDASPGGHFAAILISTQPPIPPEGQLQVRTAQVVTSLFFARVAGDVNESGSIRSFTTTEKFTEKPQATFELRFENKGNVHLQPVGDIRIYNMWGKERGVIPINHRTHFGNVLPESIRKFEFTWEGEQSLTDIGRYTAEASLAYGVGYTKYATMATSFWIIPVKAVLLTLGSILFIVYALTRIIRWYVRRMLQLAGVPAEELNSGGRVVASESESDVRIRSYKTISEPVRAGYSDFISRFASMTSLFDYVRAFWDFAMQYKKLFISIPVVLVSVVVVWNFFSDVTTTEKTFDVTINNPDTDLQLSSEEIVYQDLAAAANLPTLTDQPAAAYELHIINRSGAAGTAAETALLLARNNFSVKSITNDKNAQDGKSVIVYDTGVQEEALAISRTLGGALLSARVGSSTESVPDITVFVGADRISE